MRKITSYMSDDCVKFNDAKECLNYEAVRKQYDRPTYISMVESTANNLFDSDTYEIIITFDVFAYPHYYNMYFFDTTNKSKHYFTREEKIEISNSFDVFNLVDTNFKTVKKTLEKMYSIPLKINGVM